MATQTPQERITEIDALLAAGVKAARSGEHSLEYDLAELRRERDSLIRQIYPTSQRRKVTFTT